ncbi:DgyrCDS14288 [Dimorphilus gyrociliatus]|uniref:alpha-1,2-Mannosidase n=1 Tax=Dimorphilus gyrociliatus TaxID=2664684 RepID=A0A7I8WDH2_9ANNE|nr:DgyrCDS14288 [Dimorphilus gyrociliatus]
MLILGLISAIYLIPTIKKEYFSLEESQIQNVKDNINNKENEISVKEKEPKKFKKSVANRPEEVKTVKEKLPERNAGENVRIAPPILQKRRGRGLSDEKEQELIKKGPQNEKQRAVVNAFKYSWKAYKTFAWGHDELRPLTKSSSEWFGVGLTLIDSLDTMYIMGLHDEFNEAKNWVAKELTFDKNRDVNFFEATIRILGGLLSAYHLSKEHVFLEKATDIGDRLLGAFSSGSAIPYSDVNLKTRIGHAPRWGPDSSVSEVTTVQLEMKDLSKLTGDNKYATAVEKISNHILQLGKKDGLVPMFINARTGQFRSMSTITLGARADSYYEYLFKQWLQSNRKNEVMKNEYLQAVEGMKKHLMRETVPNRYLYFGELLGSRTFSPKMDHLVCFLAGTFALAAHNNIGKDHLDLGKRLGETCYKMYETMPTHLSPEIAYFNQVEGATEDIIVKPADTHNLQRPETVESLMYLYRITGDAKYREWGWKIFEAFEKYTKVENGYSSIDNVKNPSNVGYRNKMESFWTGETLKYLYLLFSDDVELMSIDKWVFNSEAHPLPIWND